MSFPLGEESNMAERHSGELLGAGMGGYLVKVLLELRGIGPDY